MKRRWRSILAVLALVLCLLPITAAAELLPNVGVGETLDTVSAGNQVSKNAGTIKMNNGRISKNLATGIVENNSNMTDRYTQDGLISENSGTVVSNSGYVDLNYGEVTQNKGTSFNGVTNGVGQNFGTVDTNQGQVEDNHPEGTVKYNEANSIVYWNRGTVKYNNGDISSNSGTVENMQGGTIQSSSGMVENMSGGTIQSNTGTVENMTGGTVYNSGGGSVTSCAGGDLWWAAEISGGEDLTFTDTATVDGRTFLKPGSTLAPAGERDILKVTAENAELASMGRGYRVTAITAAPVTLTVETLPAVALVQGNGNTYYTDIREAFAAANAADWNPEIILEDNVTLLEGESLTVDAGKSLTLICDGFTLSGSSEQVIDVYGSLNFIGGTLKNIANSGGVVNVHPGGMFTMYSEGTLKPAGSDGFAVTVSGNADSIASVTIFGGSVGVGAGGLQVGPNSDVTLYGGTYGKIVAGGPSDPGTTVSGLFFPGSGYAFFKDSQPVVLEPEQHTLEGPVTVRKCTHIWGNFVQTEGETHSSTCLACGKTEEAVDCAYGDWTDAVDGANHKGVCVCGREKTEEHRWEYSAGQTGKVSTISRTCGSCGRSETVGTLTISEDFHVPFGQTAGRKVEVTCDPETLELSSIRWYIDVVEALAAKGLTCNLSGKKVSTETYKFTASCHGCDIALTADVTVEPAPLPEDKIHVEEGPFTFSNEPIEPTVTVDGLIEGTDYTVEYQDNISAGTASIVLTGMGNYTGTVTRTFEIKKAALTFDGALTASDLEYDTPLSKAVITFTGDAKLDGAVVSGTWKIESTDTPDVGQHICTAVFTPADSTVAASCEPLTHEVTVTVTKAQFEIEPYIQIQAGRTLEYNLAAGLSDFLPEELLSGTEWSVNYQGVTDINSILAETPAVAGGKLTIQIKDTAAAGQSAFVRLKFDSKNWDIDLTYRIIVVDKLVPYVKDFVLEHTYDGQAPDLTEAVSQMTAEYDGEPVPGTFTVKDPESVPVHVQESGTVTVVFTPEDTEIYSTMEINALMVRIHPAEITVRVESREVTQNGAMPEPAYTVEGLAPGERLKTEPTLTCEARDTATAGTYAITAAGAEVPDGGDYVKEIVYVDGTLTVRAGGGGGGTTPVDPDPPGPDEPDPPGPDEPDPPGPDEPDPPGPDEPDPPDPGETEVKLEIKEGFTEVPPALRELEHLNTPEKLTRVMRTLLTRTGLPEGNTVVYDVALMVSTDGGKTWVPATAGNFPSGGLTVTLPYPEGTGPAYRFTVVHMFTTTDFGKTPGGTETFGPDEVKNLEAGIQVTLTGLSPVSIGWTEPQDPPKPPDPPAPDDDDDDDDDDRGSGSGGGSVSSTYRVVVEKADSGSVSASRNWASGGSAVTLTVKAKPGYRLDTLTVTDVYGREVRLTDKGGGQYGFTMPGRGDVKVKAVFAPLEEDAPCDGGEGCPSRSFADLVSGAWYHEAVDFVLERGLMSGYGDGLFGPDNRLSRAQFAQILYNQAGRPAAGEAPFADVAPDAWCAPAVAWAAEQGVAGGYGNGTFGPDDAITREQLAVMLWRYAGSPAAPGGELSFMDAEHIGAHAREAICWAVESGVMSGKSGGVLDPKGFATRAQTAQMLRNFLEQE